MRPRSLLFTIFGEYVRHYGRDIWVGSLLRLMAQFGMSEGAVRAAVSRMVKQGWLRSRRQGGKSYYYLTEKGARRLDEAAERIYRINPQQWDGRWRIVTYSIPEEQRELRDGFRRELGFLGFGALASSTWISPNPLQERVLELADQYDIRDRVELFVAEHVGPSSPAELAARVWDLPAIDAAYRDFIDRFRPRWEQARRREGMTDSEAFVERTVLVHEYRRFLFIDPDLPAELLPQQWTGREADLLFERYYRWLHPRATRFFESVYESMAAPAAR
ncbi:MAG: phenylacetic acid degradation operon negative regulatory protein PaaX [Thermaerobacter sp.]